VVNFVQISIVHERTLAQPETAFFVSAIRRQKI